MNSLFTRHGAVDPDRLPLTAPAFAGDTELLESKRFDLGSWAKEALALVAARQSQRH